MDKNTYKVLRFYNSHPDKHFSISEVAKWFPKLSTSDLVEISNSLTAEKYLRIIQGCSYQATNKGKTYKEVNRNKWLSEHSVEVVALIISIVSFGFSAFATIYSILTRQSLMP